ncbi:hypothetical protein MKX03_011449 [Papaver bracteatum]|nr:hypothetical protein MKX03_011449 [Papaver bracteatum]
MSEVYIPRLDRMLRWLGFKILQLKLDEDEFLCKYTTGLKIERSLLQISQGHRQSSMDDLICWEKRIVGRMNFPNVMAALKLPGDQLSQLQIPQLKHHHSNQNNTLIDQKTSADTMSSRDTTSIAEQNEIKKKVNFMKPMYFPRLDEMLRRLGKIQQLPIPLENLKPNEIKDLHGYKEDLKTARSFLSKSQGHRWYAMDDLIPVQLPGDLLSQFQIPQLKQHDITQNNTPIDQKSMQTSLPKAGTLLKPANLRSYALSSCKPEYQQNVVLSSLPKDGNIGQTLVSSLLQQGQAIDNSTPVLSDSPSNENCAYLECNLGGGTAATINPGKSVSTITPIERLLKVVKTSSSKALSAAVSDICSVVSMTDVFAGSYPGEGAGSSFPEDLASTTRCRVQRRNLEEINDVGQKKLKRCFLIESSLNAPPLEYNENTGCKKVNAFESSEKLKSVATSGIKKSRLEFPALPMWFLIPAKYPLCSPVLLDSLHISQSGDCAYENLITEAWINFHEFLRCMPEPTSLKEMAKSLDSCANAVFSEYARRMQK